MHPSRSPVVHRARATGPGLLALLIATGIVAGAPAEARRAAPETPPEVTISEARGFVVRASRGPGRADHHLVPRRDGRHDFPALQQFLVALRSRYPRQPPLFLRADADTPWWVVVHTLALARRGPDGRALFPVVFLVE